MKIFAFSLLLGIPLALMAHEGPPRYPDAEAHAPRPLPDRIVLTWTGDPATTQAVTWRTDTSVTHAVAEIGLALDGPQQAERTVEARTEEFTSDINEAHYHSIQFTGLAPETLYAYRVGDGTNWSEWFQFRTASREPRKFTFVYFGDAQNDVKSHWSRVFRASVLEAPRAAFTLHAGDLINRANRDAEWGDWFSGPGWVHATIPVIATPGNHEYADVRPGPGVERLWKRKDGREITVVASRVVPRGPPRPVMLTVTHEGRSGEALVDREGVCRRVDAGFTAISGYPAEELIGRRLAEVLEDRPSGRVLSFHWNPQFAFPLNGPEGLEETCYFIDYQGTRIVSLNSNEGEAEQAAWLRQVLEDNPNRWTILTFHHPMFSSARGRDNPWLRQRWKPVIDEFRVDLVLSGHDHTYARSGFENLPTGINQARDRESGTIYVVSVSGPKMYNVDREPWMVRAAEDTQLFQLITVDGAELRYEARTATGRLYDAFSLRKREGRPNELLEILPSERLRENGASS